MASFKDLDKTVTEMRNDVVCHVCKEPARPGKRQWYRCMKLHQICRDCKEKREKKKTCSCGQSISLEYCKQTEKLLSVEGLKFKCINKKNGCHQAFAENALEEHESECIYRQVPCLGCKIGPCDCKPIFHHVIENYEDVNGVEMPVQDLSKIVTESFYWWYWPLSKCTYNNQIFVFYRKYSEKIVYMWVYILGSPNEAKHYAYTLKLIGKETKISFEGKVAAIDVPFENLKAGKCFTIPREVLRAQFVNEGNKFDYLLEIRNLKEEVKDENCESGISDDEDSKQYGPNKRLKF